MSGSETVCGPRMLGGSAGNKMQKLVASDFASLSTPHLDTNSQTNGDLSIIDGACTIPLLGSAADAYGNAPDGVVFKMTNLLASDGNAITLNWHEYYWFLHVRVSGVMAAYTRVGASFFTADGSGFGNTGKLGFGVGLGSDSGVGAGNFGYADVQRSAFSINKTFAAHPTARVAELLIGAPAGPLALQNGYVGPGMALRASMAGPKLDVATQVAATNSTDADIVSGLAIYASSQNALMGDESPTFEVEYLVIPKASNPFGSTF